MLSTMSVASELRAAASSRNCRTASASPSGRDRPKFEVTSSRESSTNYPLSYRGEDRSDLSALSQPLRPSEDTGDVVVTHECSDSDRSNVSFMHRRAAKMRMSSEWRGCLCIKLPK